VAAGGDVVSPWVRGVSASHVTPDEARGAGLAGPRLPGGGAGLLGKRAGRVE
jgi:hypothetical protein